MDGKSNKSASDGKKNKNTSSLPRIVTMNELRNSEDYSNRQTYFAGGSLHSGQQILGRDDQRRNLNTDNLPNLGQGMYKEFKMITVNAGQRNEASESHPGKSFSNAGCRLGDSETTNGSTEDETQSGSSTSNEAAPIAVTLKLWENGYSIGDGELEPYEGQSSLEIINKIVLGVIPSDIPNNHNGAINLSVVDNTTQTFKKSLSSFGGTGYVLGSLTPALASNSDGQFAETPVVYSESANVKQRSDQSSANSIHENESFSSMDSMVPQPSSISHMEEDVAEDYITGYDFEYVSEEQDQSVGFQGQGYVLDADQNTASLDNVQFADLSLELPPSERFNRKCNSNNFKVTNNTNFSDGSERSTLLKVRLPNGQTVQLKVNSSCNIFNVKEYLKICVPSLSNAAFSLQLIYPKRDLKDDEMIDSDELKNTVLNLRL